MLWSSEEGSLLAESPERDSDVEGFGRPGVEVTRNIEPLRTRAMRGTAGTFAGQRPPKSPARLAEFLRRQATAEAQRAARQRGRKKSKSSSPSEYRNFISNFMKSDGSAQPGVDKFKAAAADWIATRCDGIGLTERRKAASAKRKAESNQRRAIAAASQAAKKVSASRSQADGSLASC